MLCWQCATGVKVAPALSKIMTMPSTQATRPFGAVRITFFFQSLTEICSRFCLQSKLNCGIQAHFGWLGQETHTLKKWILVSILVSKLADSVYCVLPIVDLGPAEIFSW